MTNSKLKQKECKILKVLNLRLLINQTQNAYSVELYYRNS